MLFQGYFGQVGAMEEDVVPNDTRVGESQVAPRSVPKRPNVTVQHSVLPTLARRPFEQELVTRRFLSHRLRHVCVAEM